MMLMTQCGSYVMTAPFQFAASTGKFLVLDLKFRYTQVIVLPDVGNGTRGITRWCGDDQ